MSKKYEVLKVNQDDTLMFGNFEAIDKQKVSDFRHKGDILAVKTHKDITVLKKNDALFVECVPGAVFDKFDYAYGFVKFDVKGYKQSMITLGVEPEASYKVFLNGVERDTLTSNVSGKISASIDIENKVASIEIRKI